MCPDLTYTSGNYVQLLEAALMDTDSEYTKAIVKLLIEAKSQQRNFTIKFAHTDPNKPKNYFR